MLLTLHARLGRWLQTGGHIEATDPSLEAAAEREACEESGLTDLALDPSPLLLSKHEVPCGPVRPTYHLDVQYLVLANHLVNPWSGKSRWTCAGLRMISFRRWTTRSWRWSGPPAYASAGNGLVGADSVAQHRRDVERAIEDGDEKTALITGRERGASRRQPESGSRTGSRAPVD